MENQQIEKTAIDQRWEVVQEKIQKLKSEMGQVVVGQEKIMEQMLVSLICKGHCLIVGVPGLAKTLLVSTLGKILGLSFRRIQFTPDLMPTDITGSEILQDEAGHRAFEFAPGPVFANLILADEINRTPPKTQAALLEAMQEKQVTVAGKTYDLAPPFIVYATQNPIEHEGTYPLPEAQLDRFFFSLKISYPTMAEEKEVVLRTTGHDNASVSPVLTSDEVQELQNIARDMPMPEHVLDDILKIVHSSRPDSDLSDDYIKKYVSWGAGPRASQNITLAAKALALLNGNQMASMEEVHEVVPSVLRHRVIPNYNATGDGVMVEDIISHLMK